NRLARTDQDDFQPQRELRLGCHTLSLRGGRQLRGIPHRNPLANVTDEYLLNEERARHLLFDEQRFAALSSLADKTLRDERLSEAGPLEKALALERHFAASGLYRYSLSLDFTRDPALDPIEDFVANHKTGHCEYFASALVMMLRSQGIPARMIVGYKGGDFNSLGHYYQVRQKHAHAWVEALVPNGAVPAWEVAGAPSNGGVWYRLEPTPAPIVDAGFDPGKGAVDRVVEAFDYVELLWRDYVLGLNAAKQQDNLYDPVTSRTLGSLPEWLETRHAHRLARRMAGMLGLDLRTEGRSDENESQAFDWRTGLAMMALIALGLLTAQGLCFLVQRWKRFLADRRRRSIVRLLVPPRFYRRLESLLSRMALRRAAGQTAAEFAAAAGARLGQEVSSAAAPLPEKIVAAYYRVRFGGDALDSQELAEIEQALAQLTPAVNQARP
ncbi:MAG: transglutaminase domain-containing protein, partial [Pirellulaceae bacterium]